MRRTHLTLLFLVFSLVSLLPAMQTGAVPGWEDRNLDGINDLFTDSNGDGINDVTGKTYALPMAFQDDNGDGINDLWKDCDGDGVNDYLGDRLKKDLRWVDSNGDGLMDTRQGQLRGRALMAYVLDADGDMKNDVTGVAFNGRDIYGYRFGNVDEESGIIDEAFTDSNGDGMNDRFLTPERKSFLDHGKMDRFNDADGDGIADDRRLRRGLGRQGRRGRI